MIISLKINSFIYKTFESMREEINWWQGNKDEVIV